MDEVSVDNNRERSRYELRMGDDLVAVADYVVLDDRVVVPHTEVIPARRGLGLGERLVRYALEDVRDTGMRIEPRCWFVAEFIDLNPEFADLVA
jgi:predicted GNAT family acetyltransferase